MAQVKSKKEVKYLTGVGSCQGDPPRGHSSTVHPPSPITDAQFYKNDGLVMTCCGTRERQDGLLDQNGLVCCVWECIQGGLSSVVGKFSVMGLSAGGLCTLQTVCNDDKVIKQIILRHSGEIDPHIVPFTLK